MAIIEAPANTQLYDPANVAPSNGNAKGPSMPGCLPVYRGEEIAAYALVDTAVLPRLKHYRWQVNKAGYAYTSTGEGQVPLHRFLFGLGRGEPVVVHHRNAEKLDCRRANLALLSPAEHVLAHGMRPRLAIDEGDETTTSNRANRRGLQRWLDQMRTAEDACLGESDVAMARKTGRKLPKTLTADELSRLLAAPNLDVPTGLRDRCVLELMARCGLRVSEVCGLHLRDVDWKEGEVRIRSEVAKGGREAVVYTDPATLALLERWKLARRPFGAGRPHLFVCVRQAQRGLPLSRQRVYEMVRRRSLKAGISWPVHPHALRHTFATSSLADGFTISEVQAMMRHSRLETTSVYLHVRNMDLRAKIRARRS